MNERVVAERLLKLRLEAEESQKDVAKAVNVEPMAISNYENGIRVPRDDIKVKLAEHFKVSVQSIFFD